jgi:hypothetical protein
VTAPTSGDPQRPDPASIYALVRACPDVVRLVSRSDPDGGGIGGGVAGGDVEVVSYAHGQRIEGIRVQSGVVTVRVVGRFGPPIAELAGQVRAAVLTAAPGCPRVDVIIDDLDVDTPAWAGEVAAADLGGGPDAH